MNHSDQIYLFENKYYIKESIKNLLSDDAYLFLLEHQYVKINSNGFMAFHYVGVISYGSTIICILPKFYADSDLTILEIKQKFRVVLRVLKKAGMSDVLPDSVYLNNTSEIVSEIGLADQLIRDYLDNGFYQKIRKEVLLNTNGEVDWDKTISTLDPILSGKSPIYHDQFNYHTRTEEFNIIRELHKWVIKYCLSKYGDILDYNISFPEDTYSSLSSFGVISHILALLDRELRVTYIDREIKLLKNIHRIVSKQSAKYVNELNIYGTGYFHVVWETVCSETFKNKKELFIHLIPKPKWHNLNGEEDAKDTIYPDTISINEGRTSFFVLDAKYYHLKIKEDPYSVAGNPGVGDVSKQILYEKAFISLPISNRYNLLLFPGLIDSFFEIKGFITFDLLPGHKVFNVFLNPEQIFDSYLHDTKLGYINLDKISNQIDSLT
jgi:hypothetical protein